MRKTIIFGALAALLGLMAAAQASDHAERALRNGGQATYVDTDNRSEIAEHKMRERAEYRVRDDHDDDAYEHGKEAREHKHRERHDRD